MGRSQHHREDRALLMGRVDRHHRQDPHGYAGHPGGGRGHGHDHGDRPDGCGCCSAGTGCICVAVVLIFLASLYYFLRKYGFPPYWSEPKT